jgi:VIT1/CCC1 family predicted Fe2+/Mn2+ transporter
MAKPRNQLSPSEQRQRKKLGSEKYDYLRAEAEAPYRGLRKFVYFTFGASGFIGALVFLAQLAAGRDVASALPNLALQVGVVALMIFLFRWENKAEKR